MLNPAYKKKQKLSIETWESYCEELLLFRRNSCAPWAVAAVNQVKRGSSWKPRPCSRPAVVTDRWPIKTSKHLVDPWFFAAKVFWRFFKRCHTIGLVCLTRIRPLIGNMFIFVKFLFGKSKDTTDGKRSWCRMHPSTCWKTGWFISIAIAGWATWSTRIPYSNICSSPWKKAIRFFWQTRTAASSVPCLPWCPSLIFCWFFWYVLLPQRRHKKRGKKQNKASPGYIPGPPPARGWRFQGSALSGSQDVRIYTPNAAEIHAMLISRQTESWSTSAWSGPKLTGQVH